MYHFARRLCLITVVASLGGCSIYPQPDDVTSFESENIATIIRCQTRDAIRAEIIRQLDASGDKRVYGALTGTQAATWFAENPDRFLDLTWTAFVPNLARLFAFYADVTVSYDFSIDSSEMNGAGVDLTFLKKLSGGSNSLGIVAKNDRTRQVTRHFRVFDSFDTLARKMSNRYCAGVPRQINAIYPSTGLLRIGSLVRNFVVQNQVGNLGGEKDDFTTAQMADTMVFTTKFTGNFSPQFNRDGVTNVVIPSSIKVNSDNYRQDIHTIIILLQLPVDPSKLPKFDDSGRLVAAKDARKALKNMALDKEVDYRTQQKVQEISTTLQRVNP
ncbi:MAG: hypothetical protein QOF14_768 [Hyphomicrobiales bacterium]|jgi:hypothetical protein|nr:hypothetical protein [Hyphomicrobiales bacterium]